MVGALGVVSSRSLTPWPPVLTRRPPRAPGPAARPSTSAALAVAAVALSASAALSAPAAAQPSALVPAGPVVTAVEPDPVVGSNRGQWVTLRGRGFAAPFNVRLATGDVEATVASPDNLRYVGPGEVAVFTVVGNEAARWTAAVSVAGGGTSGPAPFRVVAPRPEIEAAALSGPGGGPHTLVVLGPTLSRRTAVLWDGEPVAAEPVRTSGYASALTLGFRAALPAGAADPGGAHEVRLVTPGPGGGASDPYVIAAPPVPLARRPAVWALGVGALAVAGLGLHRRRAARLRTEGLEAEVGRRTAEIEGQRAELEARAAALDAALATQAAQADALRGAAETRARAFAGVAHDLRTPLSVAVASLDGVLGRGALGGADREEVEAARRAAGELVRLSGSLGEAARHESGRVPLSVAPVDLAALARGAVAGHAVLLGRRGVSVAVEADGAAWALADADAVRRVLGNLLDNAGRFAPGGGAVTVAVRADDGAGRAEVAVGDTGPGFAPAFVGRAFEPYVQGEEHGRSPSRAGLGLGLSVVRDLVGRMGGAVRAEPGPGGKVVVALPAAEPPAERDRGDGRGGADHRPLVVVAEDDDELRGVLVRALSGEYGVEAVADGRAALDAARRLRPAVVVSDVMMPRLDGVGLVRALRAERWGATVPVVLVTALDAPERVVGAFAAGADDYVTKPFDRRVLLARVRRLVGGRPEAVEPAGPVGTDGAPLSAEDARLVEAVRAAVEGRLGDPDLDVGALAEAAGLSAAQLTRRLKSAVGLTPRRYAESVRLDHAAGLLRAGGRLVKGVAGAVGYRDVRTFSRAFRRRFGAAPSEWPPDRAG